MTQKNETTIFKNSWETGVVYPELLEAQKKAKSLKQEIVHKFHAYMEQELVAALKVMFPEKQPTTTELRNNLKRYDYTRNPPEIKISFWYDQEHLVTIEGSMTGAVHAYTSTDVDSPPEGQQ